jgi:CMP-N-acetylneuraminic acid synthetase
MAVAEVDEVVIDTDSDLVRKSAEEFFPQVTIVNRPEHLRSGDTPMNDVLLNTIDQVKADVYLQTHSTNPFLTTNSISRGLQIFADPDNDYDSIFSVSTLHARLWSDKLKPLNHDPRVLQRTQDLAPIYLENSCFFIFTRDSLLATKNRIGVRPGVVEVNGVESIDIDNESDFLLAERIASGGAL